MLTSLLEKKAIKCLSLVLYVGKKEKKNYSVEIDCYMFAKKSWQCCIPANLGREKADSVEFNGCVQAKESWQCLYTAVCRQRQTGQCFYCCM